MKPCYPHSLETKDTYGIVITPNRHFTSTHRGVDYAPTKNHGKVVPIIASIDGRVQQGVDGYGGLWVQVYGVNGMRYFSLHLDRYANGTRDKDGGQDRQVKRGEIIGYMGNTGNSTGVHNHFEVRTASGTRIDPEKQGLVYFSSSKMIKFGRLYNFILDRGAKIALENGKEIIANADILTTADAVSDKGFHIVEYTAVDGTKHSIDGFVSFNDVNTRASEALQFRRLVREVV